MFATRILQGNLLFVVTENVTIEDLLCIQKEGRIIFLSVFYYKLIVSLIPFIFSIIPNGK